MEAHGFLRQEGYSHGGRLLPEVLAAMRKEMTITRIGPGG